MPHKHLTYPLLLLLLCNFLSCREHIVDAPLANQTPKTALWLYPQAEIRAGVSKEQIHWWGEDPDGVVRGYLFGFRIVTQAVTTPPVPDTMRYVWTSATDTTILFPLDTLFRRFAVTVHAVDNSFAGLPEHSPVRISPFPYLDANDNGIFDGGDQRLDGLSGAMDPGGKTLTFPIVNTPPTVSFVPNPIDPTVPLRQPDTTYTAATFSWTANDPDGNNTLRSYRIALNTPADSTIWLTLSLRDSLITLVVPRGRSDAASQQPGTQVPADVYGGSFLGRHLIGQIPGLRLDATNVLYVQALDVAGEYSPAITMPSGADKWYVKRPRGRLLIVNDYINSDGDLALSTYLRNLANIPGGQYAQVDMLNIGAGLSPADKLNGKAGPFTPPFVDPALIQTFLLYDYIFWYTDQYPSLATAQLSLFTYMQNGGKVLFSTTFQSGLDPRAAFKDFAPIDSISSAPFTPRPAPGDTRIPVNYQVYPDSTGGGAIYPRLAFIDNGTPFHLVFMRPIYRRSDARYIYHLQPDTANVPPRYIGMPNIAAVDGQRTIVFVGLPLHLLDNTTYGNPQGLQAFFNRVFIQEFNPLHKVNRARF